MYTPFSLTKRWTYTDPPKPTYATPEPPYELFSGKRAVLTTSKSIEEVRNAVHATVAPFPNYTKNQDATWMQTREAFQAHIQEAVKNTERPSGLFLFFEMRHHNWYRLFEPDTPKVYRYIIGNPLILKEIAECDIHSTLYGPWSFLVVEEVGKGTKILFDLPTSVLKTKQGNTGLDQAAQGLEEKFEILVRSWL